MGENFIETNLPTNVSYSLREVQNIRKEIKRLGDHVKELREHKKSPESVLYEYMQNNEIGKLAGITIGSVKPKPKVKRKTMKEKKEEALALFETEGIEDPERVWENLKRTQKSIILEDVEDKDEEEDEEDDECED